MKKSKLILPALASICLGAAASVSGTLAWFTADKNASVSISEFAIINPTGSLSASATNIKNTTANKGTVALDSGYSLTDGSLNFTMNSDTTKKGADRYVPTCYYKNGSSYSTVDSPYAAIASQKIYRCAAFSVSFSYNGNNENNANLSVYLDIPNSTFENKKDQTDNEVLDSFRMAFWSDTLDVVYWTPRHNDAVEHVKSTSSTESITGVTTAQKIGEVSPAGATTSVTCTVYCYMWFDGEDANCNGEKLTQMQSKYATAKLAFYAA